MVKIKNKVSFLSNNYTQEFMSFIILEDDEDNINHKVPKSPELVCSMDNLKDLTVNDEQTDNLKDSIVNDNNLSSVKSNYYFHLFYSLYVIKTFNLCITDVEFCEIKSIDSRKEQHFKIRIVNDDRGMVFLSLLFNINCLDILL